MKQFIFRKNPFLSLINILIVLFILPFLLHYQTSSLFEQTIIYNILASIVLAHTLIVLKKCGIFKINDHFYLHLTIVINIIIILYLTRQTLNNQLLNIPYSDYFSIKLIYLLKYYLQYILLYFIILDIITYFKQKKYRLRQEQKLIQIKNKSHLKKS